MASRMDRYNKPQEPESKSRNAALDCILYMMTLVKMHGIQNIQTSTMGIPIDLSGIKKGTEKIERIINATKM